MLHKESVVKLKKNHFMSEKEIKKILFLINKNGYVVIKNFYSK